MSDKPKCPELVLFLAQNFAPEPKPQQPDKLKDYVLWKPSFEGEEPPF